MLRIFTCGYQITVLKVISSAFIVNQNNQIVYFDHSTKLHFSSQLINKMVNMKRFHAIDFSDRFNGHQKLFQKVVMFRNSEQNPWKRPNRRIYWEITSSKIYLTKSFFTTLIYRNPHSMIVVSKRRNALRSRLP